MDIFVIDVGSLRLGPLLAISIGYAKRWVLAPDAVSADAAWNLQRVEVTDMQTGVTMLYEYQGWINQSIRRVTLAASAVSSAAPEQQAPGLTAEPSLNGLLVRPDAVVRGSNSAHGSPRTASPPRKSPSSAQRSVSAGRGHHFTKPSDSMEGIKSVQHLLAILDSGISSARASSAGRRRPASVTSAAKAAVPAGSSRLRRTSPAPNMRRFQGSPLRERMPGASTGGLRPLSPLRERMQSASTGRSRRTSPFRERVASAGANPNLTFNPSLMPVPSQYAHVKSRLRLDLDSASAASSHKTGVNRPQSVMSSAFTISSSRFSSPVRGGVGNRPHTAR